jgi:flagellar export protein FliJ
VAGAEAETEKQRQILLDAAKERKTLETLKEQKLLSHRAETDRQERNFFDEVATMRHHRERDKND